MKALLLKTTNHQENVHLLLVSLKQKTI